MNGAVIPAIVWFTVSFSPTLMGHHISVSEPMPKAQCIATAHAIARTVCRSMRLDGSR